MQVFPLISAVVFQTGPTHLRSTPTYALLNMIGWLCATMSLAVVDTMRDGISILVMEMFFNSNFLLHFSLLSSLASP